MYVLGIDTSTRVAGAAVMGKDRLISERFIHNEKTHSQNIIPMISQVLDDAGIKPEHLNGIAVTAGPGSFTGLRIGMSVAKTMGQVLGIPVAGISTLKALAWNIAGIDGMICPILDAKKQEVYAGIYRSSSGGLEEVMSPSALSIDKVLEELSNRGGKVTFLGDGVPVYYEYIKEKMSNNACFATKINSFPRASAAAELGLARIKEGGLPDSLLMHPVYLRKSEAEITWEKKQGKKG